MCVSECVVYVSECVSECVGVCVCVCVWGGGAVRDAIAWNDQPAIQLHKYLFVVFRTQLT